MGAMYVIVLIRIGHDAHCVHVDRTWSPRPAIKYLRTELAVKRTPKFARMDQSLAETPTMIANSFHAKWIAKFVLVGSLTGATFATAVSRLAPCAPPLPADRICSPKLAVQRLRLSLVVPKRPNFARTDPPSAATPIMTVGSFPVRSVRLAVIRANAVTAMAVTIANVIRMGRSLAPNGFAFGKAFPAA
jgi:hypothetical protein